MKSTNYKKRIFLVSNAHLDPVWQWEWDEGASAAVSTFRTAARFCREYDGYVFCHNEGILYEWVREYEPKLYEQIQSLVEAGKWNIIGGWYIQPDCNMPAGETFIRHAAWGRKYFKKNFNSESDVGVSFDAFGHSRGLVQILSKCGYKYYLHCRPSDNFCKMPSDYKWIGYDGSQIIAHRSQDGYGTGLGGAVGKARAIADMTPEGGVGLCLWGVGDHGGGASKADLDALDAFMKQAAADGISVKHSTPDEYFAALDVDSLPEWDKGMNPWAVGCYTSQSKLKHLYRRLEDQYYFTEKAASAAFTAGVMAYPAEELSAALTEMLTATFHDYLPGSSVEPVEEMGVRKLGGAADALCKVRTRAFFALCAGQKPAETDEIPILVMNPHPYPVRGDFECEFMLWDQGWGDEIQVPRLTDEDGLPVPSQPEKENSSIPIDWRKRICFSATVKPMSVSRFHCRFDTVKKSQRTMSLPTDGDCYVFSAPRMSARLNKKTGLLDSYTVDGAELLRSGAMKLEIFEDSSDPWEMTVTRIDKHIGYFTLLSPEEGTAFCALKDVIPSVRIIEDGPVRTVCEAVFGYNSSRAVVTYKFSKTDVHIDIGVRVDMLEKQKMLKLCVPAYESSVCIGQTAYGKEELVGNGDETVAQRYRLLKGEKSALLICNDSVYGGSFSDNTLKYSLLRTAVYTAHPLGDRKVLPTDRFMPHIDIGEQKFSFRMVGGEARALEDNAERISQAFSEQPYALSFFPSGDGVKPKVPFTLEGDPEVVLTALKRSEYDDSFVIRLFNNTDKPRVTKIVRASCADEITLLPYSFETYRLDESGVTPLRADEAE